MFITTGFLIVYWAMGGGGSRYWTTTVVVILVILSFTIYDISNAVAQLFRPPAVIVDEHELRYVRPLRHVLHIQWVDMQSIEVVGHKKKNYRIEIRLRNGKSVDICEDFEEGIDIVAEAARSTSRLKH